MNNDRFESWARHELEERIRKLEAALRAVEYSDYIREEAPPGEWHCHICGKTEGYGHYPGCAIGVALGDGETRA